MRAMSVPNEGSQSTPTGSISMHRELDEVKVPRFICAMDNSASEAWLENLEMCFTLCDFTNNMKFHMVVFQLKGSVILWWKMILPQLNMVFEDISWNLFEEQFW
jgi:hypothetical protein